MATETTKRLIWPILVGLVLFTITIGVPTFGKVYIDLKIERHETLVMRKITLLNVKMNLILDLNNIPIPKEEDL